MKSLRRVLVSIGLCAPLVTHGMDLIANTSMLLSIDEVRDIYLGEKLLAGNVKLIPVDNSSVQDEFLAKVLQTDRDKYYARWARKVYREGLSTPPTKGSDAEVAAFVKATPGAIGYVTKAPAGVRVLHSY